VTRGFQEKNDVAVDLPTISKNILRVIISIATFNRWKLKTSDIKSAFLQGKKIDRDVFVIPPKEAKLPQGRVWKLK
jgi:hypothetical protein